MYLLVVLALTAAAVEAKPSGAVWYQKEEHLLAAKEVRRYVYHATNRWLDLHDEATDLADLLEVQNNTVVLHERDDVLIERFSLGSKRPIGEQSYVLKTTRHHGLTQLFAIGGDSTGVLYAAYAIAEKFGVRFRLYGDIIPEETMMGEFRLPNLDEFAEPAFDVRGLQPFHDFPEGPDWWGETEYKAITTQISKQKMNFIGLHTYPHSPGSNRGEPTVWIGLKEDVNEDGTVKQSYATSYANTMRNQWGYAALPTGNYSYGASQIFDMDCYSSSVQLGNCPYPTTPQGNNAVFDKTGLLLKNSFEHAHAVGVKTCVGTETPLTIPQAPPIAPLNLYYSKSRQDNFLTTTQCAECEGVYEFVRIEGFVHTQSFPGSIPLNTYYNGQLMDNVLSPKPPGEGYGFVRTEGYASVNSSSTSGNFSTLMTYYNAQIHDHLSVSTAEGESYAKSHGYTLVGSVASVMANGTAVAPSTQDYYEGIFTRLQKMGLPLDYYWIWTPEGWEWGKMTSKNPVFESAVNDLNSAAAAHDSVNASFKLATCGWVVGPLPDRTIFDKVLSAKYSAVTSIDMSVGNTPVDPSYMNITKHGKWAIPWMEDDPGLTAPELWVNRTLMHMEDAKKYGCQGLLGIHWRTRQTSPQIAAMAQKSWNFDLTSEQFWASWSMEEFGISDPAAVFSAIESYNLPRPVNWGGGPGVFKGDVAQCTWGPKYGFVDTLASMKSKVKPNSSYMDRFEYWVNTFMYMRAISATECVWGQYNEVIAKVSKETDPPTRQKMAETLALPLREQLVQNATQMMTYLLQTVSSTGELGTIMNVLSHSLIHAIEEPAAQLESYLGHPLGGNAVPTKIYSGPTKLIVPTVRTMVSKGENITVRALVLSSHAVHNVSLYRRDLADKRTSFIPTGFTNLNRNVFEVQVAPMSDFEYYVTAYIEGETEQYWPPGNSTQSVVVV